MWGEKSMRYMALYDNYLMTEATRAYVRVSHSPSWWEVLLRVIYRSDFSPLIVLSFLFALGIIAKKWPHKAVEVIATILAFSVTIVPTIHWFTPGSITMLRLAIAFVMTATVFILNFVKLRILDYAILFSCFAFLSRFVGIASSVTHIASRLGMALPALITLITILIIYRVRLGQLKGNLFYCWFTSILVFISGYVAHFLFWRYVVHLGQTQETMFGALFVWGITVSFVCGLSALLIFFVMRLLKKHFDNINRMGKTYPLIERFIIINSIVILLLMGLTYYFFGEIHITHDPAYGWVMTRQYPILELANLILMFFMILQLSFIIMIFRITWLKDNLKVSAVENQSLAAYSSSLEKSMNDIKNIKHDVKNIFLTMGNFVERSGDKEMQEFYSKKISPFAVDEITKNDLLGKLARLDNEQLKAFIFYKISQAVERDVDIDLDISAQVPNFERGGRFSIEFIDLVRILGILFDNAIEECVEIPDGRIFVRISRNDEMISYVIKNTVRQEIKEKGIRPGASTKGKDRGKGLVGVRNIINKYDAVLLNSYFSEDYFVQSLIVHASN